MNPITLRPRHESETAPLTGANTGAAEPLTAANAKRLLNILGPSAQAIPAVQELLREIPSGISSAAGSVLRGETDPLEIAYNGLIGEAANQVSQLFPGVPVADLLVSNVKEARRASPNYGASTLAAGARTGSGMLGQAILPIPGVGYMVGSSIGNYFAQESIRDGYLGDWSDSRSNERQRDAVEDLGKSVSDTKDLAARDNGWQNLTGEKSPFGLQAEYDATPLGRIENSSNIKAFYGGHRDDYGLGGEDNVGGTKGSSTGTGGGYNDGKGGVTGL